jgi:hypothetical protein
LQNIEFEASCERSFTSFNLRPIDQPTTYDHSSHYPRQAIMIYNKFILALAISAGLMDVAFAQGFRNGGGRGGKASTTVATTSAAAATTTTTTAAAATTTTAAAATSAAAASTNTTSDATAGDLALNPANVQTGSQQNGQAVAEAGQVASDT